MPLGFKVLIEYCLMFDVLLSFLYVVCVCSQTNRYKSPSSILQPLDKTQIILNTPLYKLSPATFGQTTHNSTRSTSYS